MAENEPPRTVFAPNPGGRRTAAQPPASNSLDLGVPAAAAQQGIDVDSIGVNPLVDAAAELLELAVYLLSLIHI